MPFTGQLQQMLTNLVVNLVNREREKQKVFCSK